MRDHNDIEKKKYMSWALQCVEEWKDSGKNVLPLLSEMKKSMLNP